MSAAIDRQRQCCPLRPTTTRLQRPRDLRETGVVGQSVVSLSGHQPHVTQTDLATQASNAKFTCTRYTRVSVHATRATTLTAVPTLRSAHFTRLLCQDPGSKFELVHSLYNLYGVVQSFKLKTAAVTSFGKKTTSSSDDCD